MITIPNKVLDACDKDMLFLYSAIKRRQGKAAYLVTSCAELADMVNISKSSLWRMLKKMSELGVCETANETANETAKGLRIYTNSQSVTKSRTKPRETANETAKTSTLSSQAKEVFMTKYQWLFQNPYYWEVKDSVAMKKLLQKIEYSRKNRDVPLPTDDGSMLTAIGQFLDCIDDPWILEHYTMTVITSKYNEIVQNAKNKRHGNNKQSKDERTRTELASAAATFARLDAERRASLGGTNTADVW